MADERRDDSWQQREISERERLLSEAERVAHMGSWVWNLVTNELHWSDELYRMLELDPREIAPKPETFYTRLIPEDAERMRRGERDSVTRGMPPPSTVRMRRADGSLRELYLDGTMIRDERDQPVRLVGIVIDVTEERRAERALARTAATLDEAQRVAGLGSWRKELPSGRLEWSAGLCRLFGLPESTPPSEELLIEMVHPDDRHLFIEARARGLAGGSVPPLEVRVVRPDGSVRHHLAHTTAQVDGNGKLVAFLGTNLDVTERRQLEAQLRQAQKMEALGRLAGGIAHDFNNLLTVIASNAQYLNRSYELGTELTDILQAADRASGLVRQLLAFSRQVVLNPEILDLGVTLAQAQRLLGRLLGDRIEIRLRVAEDLWKVRVDDTQMLQVVMNLALNARDAMPLGGRLELELDNVELDGSSREILPRPPRGPHVRLTVRDSGTGMDETTRQRAFEPFFSTKGQGGTGLGLATVFGIVTQSGGALELASAPGQGTTFRVYFPRAASVA